MKILIVDDEKNKAQKLIRYLMESCDIQRDDIIFVQCSKQARQELKNTYFNLLILDVVLPFMPEDDPHESVSVELLEEIHVQGNLIKPRQIIGLTAYDNLSEAVTEKFTNALWTIIKYDQTCDDWLLRVKKCILYISNCINEVQNINYKIDLCVVVALHDPELQAILNLDWNWEPAEPIDDSTFVHYGNFLSNQINYRVAAVAAPRMGMLSTAILSSTLINILRPKFLVMAGICAGIKNKINIGDIIFADSCWDWQSGKRVSDGINSKFSISPHQLAVPQYVCTRVKELENDLLVWSNIRKKWPNPPNTILQLKTGPIASGSAVLADNQVVETIKDQHRNLLGIEMEVYGLYAAAFASSRLKPTTFAMKSVCDYADESKCDDFQKYAAYTSASAIKEFFERYMTDIINHAGRF